MSGFGDFLVNHHVPQLVTSSELAASEDFVNGNVVSDVANLEEWEGALFIVTKLDSSAAATGTSTALVYSCDDASASTATAVIFWERHSTTPDVFSAWARVAATGQIIAVGDDQTWEFAISSSELYKGTAAAPVNDQYVKFVLNEVSSGQAPYDGGVVTILYGAKHAHEIPNTVLT